MAEREEMTEIDTRKNWRSTNNRRREEETEMGRRDETGHKGSRE